MITRPPLGARARRFLVRVRALSRKEWMHIARDPSTIAFAAVMPLILLVLFGFAVSFDVDGIRTVVVDQDRTAESRALADHLFSGPTFRRVGEAPSAEAVEPWFRGRRASVGLVIPEHYARRLQRGEAVTVQILVDAADNVTAGSVLSYAARFAARTNHGLMTEVVGRAPEPIEARVRALFNPGMRSAVFLVPGLVALIQAIMAVMLTSLTVAREWERGSMEQLFSTPVGRLEIALGKLLPYFVVALGQLLVILAAATWLFDVPLRGSLPALFGLSSLFLYAALSQGLLISVVTKNQQVATQAAAVSSMLPSMLLSGFALPIDNMPRVLQVLTNVVPARHYVHAIRALMLRGVEPSALLGDALALAAIGTALLALATARFSKEARVTSLAALVRKELIQAFRDRRMLFMLLMVPVIQVVLFGYAANLEFDHADTVVVDDDRTVESRDLLRGLGAEGTFTLRSLLTDEAAVRAVQLGEAQVAVIVPRRFGDRLNAGLPAEVQVLVDGTEPTRAVGAAAAVQAYAAGRSRRLAAAAGAAGPVPQIVLQPRLYYNPSLKSRLFMVPGTAASILLIVTTVVTAMGLARERELGTMEQLLVTPIHPIVLMVGKTVPYALFGLFDEAAILVVGNLLFDVPLRGSLALVFAGTLAYLMATLSVGLLISTVARTQQQAIMGGFFFLMPALLLSGFITPIEAMPWWIRPITYLIPVRYFIEIIRGVLLRGATLSDLGPTLAALAALGAAYLLLAAWRFERTIG